MSVKSLAQSSLTNSHSVNSMLGGYESNYFHHLETVRLSSSAASISFTNLDRYKDFEHLQLVAVTRQTAGGYTTGLRIRLNNDSSSTYTRHYLYTSGSPLSSGGGVGTAYIGLDAGNGATAGIFGGNVVDLLDVFDSNKNTTMHCIGGVSSQVDKLMHITSCGYFNTSPVTTITMLGETDSHAFSTGSRVSLYGLKARS